MKGNVFRTRSKNKERIISPLMPSCCGTRAFHSWKSFPFYLIQVENFRKYKIECGRRREKHGKDDDCEKNYNNVLAHHHQHRCAYNALFSRTHKFFEKKNEP